MSDVLLSAASVMYASSGAGFMASLARARPSLLNAAKLGLLVGAAIHALALLVRFIQLGLPPVTNGFEGLSLLSLLIAVIFLVLQRRYPVQVLGAFVAPLVFLHLTASLLFTGDTNQIPAALKSAYFYVHITLAFLGDAFLAVAAAASVSYLLQERKLRLKKVDTLSGQLPNLNLADHIAHRCLAVGFLFMSLGIASGVVYAKHAWHAYWSWDPKQNWSALTWLVYALMLHFRFMVGWRGRRLAWLTVGAFALVVTGAVVMGVFNWGRHTGDYDAMPASTSSSEAP
ncbi:MAG: cytochrome c biogenesis protein CcsA [Myxococcota bacterium]